MLRRAEVGRGLEHLRLVELVDEPAPLDGRLSELLRMELYPGPLNTGVVVLNDWSREDQTVHPGAIIAGLGMVGELTPGALASTLANALTSGSVTLQYALDSDGGLELGGWTVDGLCVIQVVESFCGDSMTSGDEECDDGNQEDGDGCDATCMLEDPDPTGDDTGADTGDDTGADTGDDDPDTTAGDGASVDGTVSATSPDPTGADETSTGDTEEDNASDDGCGCTSARGPTGLLALFGLLALRRRRRSGQEFCAR